MEGLAKLISFIVTDPEADALISKLPKNSLLVKALQKIRAQQQARLGKGEGLRTPFCRHQGSCQGNCARGFIRSFVLAYLVKYAVAILPPLLTGKLLKKPQLLIEYAGKDTIQFASFISLFVGGFKGLNCLFRHLRNKDDNLNVFAAGSISSLSLLLDDKSRRMALSLYISTRVLEFAYLYLMKRNYVPNIPHGDTIIMALSSSQILYAYIMDPHTLNKSYLSFLYEHGGIARRGPRHKEFLKDFGDEVLRRKPIDIYKYREMFKDFPIPLDVVAQSRELTLDACIHPTTTSCLWGNTLFFIQSIPRSLSLYVPLNLVMGLIFRYKLLLKRPDQFLLKTAMTSARSSLFLSCYCTIAWYFTCLARGVLHEDYRWMYYVNGILSGSCVLIEAKGRRMELAMYCAPRALESLWNSFVSWGYTRNIKNGEALYFSAAMGVLLTIYQNEPEHLNSAYQSVLQRLFGQN